MRACASAAAAAPAHRKSSASGTEKPIPSPPKSRKKATARTSQQADTSAHACEANRREVVRGLSQPPSRKRRKRSVAARRGSARINVAAMRPAAATTASPARRLEPTPGRTAPASSHARLADPLVVLARDPAYVESFNRVEPITREQLEAYVEQNRREGRVQPEVHVRYDDLVRAVRTQSF